MSSVCIINGVTYINGIRQGGGGLNEPEKKETTIKLDNITLNPEETFNFLAELRTKRIAIKGGNISTTSTSVELEGSSYNISSTSGNVSCKNTDHASSTSGNVEVNCTIQGGVKTVSGDISG
jgi:hypothetical protein